MQTDTASEHLQVIRTLMERSAVYRRALAPMMLLAGAVGTLAAGVGLGVGIRGPTGFILYWLGVSLVPLAGSLLLVRRQALQDAEPFWSPPARRVVRAAVPPGLVGLVFSLVILGMVAREDPGAADWRAAATRDLPLAWVALYGCALHAAGFFTPRTVPRFGWVCVIGACLAFAVLHLSAWGIALGTTGRGAQSVALGHWIMGGFFGLLHLAYGFYLNLTENKANAA